MTEACRLRLCRGCVVALDADNKDCPKWRWDAPEKPESVQHVVAALAGLKDSELAPAKKLRMLAESFMKQKCTPADPAQLNELPPLMYNLYLRKTSADSKECRVETQKVLDTAACAATDQGSSPTVRMRASSTNREAIKQGLQSDAIVWSVEVEDARGESPCVPSKDSAIGKWLNELAVMASGEWEHEKDLQLTAIGAWCVLRSETCSCMQRSGGGDTEPKYAFQSVPEIADMLMVAAETSFEDLGIP
eukprot:546635-Amphidinium_carterae.1